MQRRKLSDPDDIAESSSSASAGSKYRIVRKISKSASKEGLSSSDFMCVGAMVLLLVAVPLYAISSALGFSASHLASPITGGRAQLAETVLNGLFYGEASGKETFVPGWSVRWADTNRTQLEQVSTRDVLLACNAIDGLTDPTTGMKVCIDGGEGAFPAPGLPAGKCIMYSFSLLPEADLEGLSLRAEYEAASRGCEVHVFSPLLTQDGERVSVDVVKGTPAQPAPMQGSVTLHAILGSSQEYDPDEATAGRDPGTLRPEQQWHHMRVGTIMSRLGHGEVHLIRVKGLEGREWPMLHDCLVVSEDGCGSRVSALSVEFWLSDRDHPSTLEGGVELSTLSIWATTMARMVEEGPMGLGFKQVDRAAIRSSGSASLGLSATDPKYRTNPRLSAAFASGSSSLYDGRVAKVVRAAYVKRSLDSIVQSWSHGKYASAAEYTSTRLSAFCQEGQLLAQAEYGVGASLNSPGCPQQEQQTREEETGTEASSEEGQEAGGNEPTQ